jgi:hypothetical protein
MIGSEDVVGEDGWAYDDLLSRFLSTTLSVQDFCGAAVDSFEQSYSNSSGSTISVVDLGKVDGVLSALSSMSDSLYAAADSDASRVAIREAIFADAEDFYTTPGDLNIDLWSLADVIETEFDYADSQAMALKHAVEVAVTDKWNHPEGNPGAKGLAVHFVRLTSTGEPADHRPEYIRGALAGQIEFVLNSSWVPVHPAGPGLLHRLWYETLP